MRSQRHSNGVDIAMSGYQAGILYATGYQAGPKYVVRNVDRWYCDAVQPLFGTAVYAQRRPGRDKPQYVVKGTAVSGVDLASVWDAPGFCRAYIELKSSLDLWQGKTRRGSKTPPKPRLRIFGDPYVLERMMDWLPAAPKKLQSITNRTQDGYTGQTYAIYYQSRAEVEEIIQYISGYPRNDALWAKWEAILTRPHP